MTTSTFVAEGIVRYGAVQATLRAFETDVENSLRKAITNYPSNPSFKRIDNKIKSDATGKLDRYVWAAIEVALAKKKKTRCWLELGLWWKGDEVAYYAGFVDENDVGIEFDLKNTAKPFEKNKWSNKKARLFMEVPASPDVVRDIGKLLDMLAICFEP